MKEPLTRPLGSFAIAKVLFDIGDHAGIENALPIVRGIKTAIQVEVRACQVQSNLLGYLLQGLEALGQQHHICFIDRSHGDRR